MSSESCFFSFFCSSMYSAGLPLISEISSFSKYSREKMRSMLSASSIGVTYTPQ